MKKVMFLFLALCMIINRPCRATDISGDDLLSLVMLTKESATPDKITSMLGKPGKVEENKRKSWWFYSKGKANMVVCWNKKSETLEKVSFNSEGGVKSTFDIRVSNRLRSGITSISQALQLLGMPKDMTIKASTQEIHYAYENKVLRLFFRDRTLVDFCLY